MPEFYLSMQGIGYTGKNGAQPMPIIPTLGRLTQEDCKFEVILGYRARLGLKREWGRHS